MSLQNSIVVELRQAIARVDGLTRENEELREMERRREEERRRTVESGGESEERMRILEVRRPFQI